MTAYIPEWMRCINCKESARGGAIKHTRRCPDYRPPNLVTARRVTLGDLLEMTKR